MLQRMIERMILAEAGRMIRKREDAAELLPIFAELKRETITRPRSGLSRPR